MGSPGCQLCRTLFTNPQVGDQTPTFGSGQGYQTRKPTGTALPTTTLCLAPGHALPCCSFPSCTHWKAAWPLPCLYGVGMLDSNQVMYQTLHVRSSLGIQREAKEALLGLMFSHSQTRHVPKEQSRICHQDPLGLDIPRYHSQCLNVE